MFVVSPRKQSCHSVRGIMLKIENTGGKLTFNSNCDSLLFRTTLTWAIVLKLLLLLQGTNFQCNLQRNANQGTARVSKGMLAGVTYLAMLSKVVVFFNFPPSQRQNLVEMWRKLGHH